MATNNKAPSITTVRVSAKKALPLLQPIIHDVIVPTNAEMRVLANLVYRVYILMRCRDEESRQELVASTHKDAANSTVHRHCLAAMSTLRGQATTPDVDIMEAVEAVREKLGPGYVYPERDYMGQLVTLSADQLEFTCRQHVLLNFPRWLERWLFVRAFEALCGWDPVNGSVRCAHDVSKPQSTPLLVQAKFYCR